MKSANRKKVKPTRNSVAQRVSSSKAKSRRGISPSPAAGSFGTHLGYMDLNRMIETLKPHDHLCLIYESQGEWRAAVVPFITTGLKSGEKCVYLVDTNTAAEVRKNLGKDGVVDVAAAEKSGQLSFLRGTEAYIREGYFDPDRVIDFLVSETEKAIADGYQALRIICEMTWVLRGYPGSEKLLEYEAKLNSDLFLKYPCLAICQYDRLKFDPEVIKGVIMTHPLVVRGDRIYRNFYYIAPGEFLKEKRAETEVKQWLDNIEREHQTHEKYLTVLEEIEEGYYELDLDGDWIFFNDTFCNTLGYSREELTGMNYRAVTFEEDADIAFNKFEEAYRTGEAIKDLSFRAVCKDGSVRLIEASAFPVRNTEGSIIGFRGIGRDITERKRMEEVLASEATRRRVLMDESRDGIVVLDEDGNVVDVNQRFADMLGYSVEEVLKLHTWDWDIKWTREELLEKGRGIDEAGVLLETRHRRKDGTVYDVDISVNSVVFEGKKFLFNVCRDVTERKQLEEELQKSERHHRTLVENAIEGIVVTQDGKIKFVNPLVAIVSGYSAEELQSMDLKDMVHPDDEKAVMESLGRLAAPGTLQVTPPFRFQTKGGEVRLIEATVVSIMWDGKAANLNLLRDLTNSKRAEDTLRDEEARYRYLFEHSQVANALVGLDGKIVDVNQAAAELYGYDKSEIIGMDLLEFIAPESKAKVTEAFASGLVQSTAVPMEVEVDAKGGRRTFFFPGGYHTLFEGGKEKGFLISAVDVTERKRMEGTLADEATRQRILMDQSRDGIVVLDGDGKVYEVNQRFADMLGYSLEEARELNVWDWEFQYPPEQVKEMIRTVDEKGDHFETRHRRKDGTVYDVEISTNGAVIAGQKLIFCVCRDITERKQAEERMRHLNLVLRAIRNVNQLIARGADRDNLLKGVCENFVQTRGYYNAWIALPDESGKLLIAAEAGMDENFTQVIERLKRGELPDCGWKALKKSGVVVIEDPLSACTDCPLSKDYAGRGGMSIRLEYGGKVYGMMAVSAPLEFLGHKEEHDLFEEVAGDIAFALHSMEQERERSRAEEALRDSEERYRRLIETAYEGVWIVDDEGKTTFVNARMAEMLGYTADEMVDKSLFLFMDEEWKLVAEKKLGRRRMGIVEQYEFNFRRKDGSELWTTIAASPISDRDGRYLGSLMMVTDITEHRRADEALAEEAIRRRILMDQSRDGISILDENSKLVEANQRFAEMLGYTSEELRDFHTWDWDTQWTREELLEMGRNVDEAGAHLETRHRRKDGTFFDVELSVNSAVVAGRKLLFCVSRDITERKKAGEALRRSEQNFRDSIENSPYGIRVLGKKGGTLYANRALMDMWGYNSIEELEAVPSEQRYTPESYAEYLERSEKRKRGEPVSHSYETNIVRSDGEVRILLVSRRELMWNGEKRFQLVYQDITERKQMERELAVRNSISDIFLGFPGEEMYGEVLKVVLAATESKYGIFGYIDEDEALVVPSMTREIWENCRVADKSTRCPRERWSGIWGRALTEKKSLYANGGLHLPEGHIPLKRVLVVPVMYKGGVIGLLQVADRVTDYNDDNKRFLEAIADHIAPILHARLWRDREERKREQAEEEYQTIISTSMDGFAVHDIQGRFLDVNEAYCNLLGYSRDELLNMSVSDIEAAEESDEIVERVQKAKEVGYDRFETRHRRKNGGIVDVDVSINYLPTDGGRIFVFIRDITERKRIEEELRTSRDYLDRTLNSIVEVLMVVDTDYNIIDINRSFSEYYGGKRKGIIGRKCYEVLHKSSKPCSEEKRRCPLQTVLNTGKPFYAEHVYKVPEGGQEFIFEVSMFPLVDSAGNIEALVEMQHDITESKRAEEEKGQLEQKAQVASRLASVGEMAAGIAHEINNPLTSVIGYSQLLSDRDDIPEDARIDLKAIDEGAQRVAGIIKRLLTFARQTRPERMLANVNELITNTLDLRGYHLRTNNIKVTTELATDLPITMADPAQLQQVFLNIIVNAETAMKLARGKGRLLIKTEEVNGTMRISFKDNGPGIAKENLVRIFDPFFTTREVGQGTGLGLSICHGIVAEHNGRLWVESEVGKGSTFIVELPIVVESTRLETVEPAVEKPQKVPRARMLVVDDEPSTLEFLSRLLTNEGHEVDTVSNAAEAFEMVKNKRYSLILLDIKMPGASGIELYGRMQKIAQSFAERVIFITGDIMGTDTESFLSKTKAPYITKPFEVNELKKTIEHFLTGGQ
jgi:PAS domain S-box-containing protein